jgi:hypothetical protein
MRDKCDRPRPKQACVENLLRHVKRHQSADSEAFDGSAGKTVWDLPEDWTDRLEGELATELDVRRAAQVSRVPYTKVRQPGCLSIQMLRQIATGAAAVLRFDFDYATDTMFKVCMHCLQALGSQ